VHVKVNGPERHRPIVTRPRRTAAFRIEHLEL
jgi:hypothetical protein